MKAGSALVTGATGFVGSHLCRRLVAEGWKVHIVTRPGSAVRTLGDFRDAIAVHTHDSSTASLVSMVSNVRPAVVFHLASLFLAEHTTDDVDPLVTSNVLFGAQLLQAMAQAGCTSLVNAGTSWQHAEGSAYSPVCLYAATKQAFEDILEYYSSATGVRAITLKLFDTYGPFDHRPKLFNALRMACREGRTLPMSAGEQLLDLVYVDDVVQAFLIAANRLLENVGRRSESYAVSSGTRLSLCDVVEAYRRVTGCELQVAWGARPYRPREVMRPWSEGALLPGWRPQVSLEEGIRRMEGLACAAARK